MTLNEFKDFYYNVCNVDYNKMKIAMEPLKELMNKTDKVHIIAPGTNVTFSIKGIPAEKMGNPLCGISLLHRCDSAAWNLWIWL